MIFLQVWTSTPYSSFGPAAIFGQTVNMEIEKCCICGRKAYNHCLGCNSTKYCSAKCQVKDWPLHKLLCSKFSAFIEAGPPVDTDNDDRCVSPSYKLALLFPEHSTCPELIWVESVKRADINKAKSLLPAYHFGEDISKSLSKHVKQPQSIVYEQFSHALLNVAGGNAIQECASNKCFDFLNAGYHEQGLDVAGRYFGNIVTFRCHIEEIKSPTLGIVRRIHFQDVTLADLRLAYEKMAVTNTIFEGEKPNPYFLRTANEWVEAVKINFNADTLFRNKPRYCKVVVRRIHNIFLDDSFYKADISTISLQMKFPLLVLKVEAAEDGLQWMGSEQICMVNREVIYLMHNTDVLNESKLWGSADPKHWNHGVDYAVLVARKDMKDLTTHQVEALVLYIKDVVVEYMNREDRDKASHCNRKIRQHIVDEFMFSGKFRDFFENLKVEKIRDGDSSWAEARYPGDV